MCIRDRYGPGKVEKYVDGRCVESFHFKREYRQNRNYSIEIKFSPEITQIDAFGEKLHLVKNSRPIKVGKVFCEIAQQDAFIDNIIYRDEVRF